METRRRTVKFEECDGEVETVHREVLSGNVTMDGEQSKVWKKKIVKDEYRLLGYHDLPDYLKDNEYILGHYRVDLTYGQALSSLFRVHNETVNIWT